jgi:formylglycine-generating enzyme required for sulfatase activity
VRKINAFIILMFTCVSHLLYANSQPAIEPIMVALPSGEFLMGSKATDSEQPVHKVKVHGFQLAKYNVTVKEFLLFTKATDYKQTSGCLIKEDKNAYEIFASWGALNASHGEFIPINCVSWKDTQAYIAWLNTQTGKRYRLPSEAEWEYAAAAGSNKLFHFGNNEKQLCQYENVYDATALLDVGRDSQWTDQAIGCDDGEDKLSTVGIYQPNLFGLYDMLGNTSEWVEDCYHPNYQGAPKASEAWLTKDCTVQFARGGSWTTNSNYLRSRFRPSADAIKITTAERFYDRGFRLASDTDDTNILSEQQKAFLADLAKAQQAAITRSTIVAKKREELLKEYKTWKKSPVFIPPMVTIPSGEFLMGSNASKKEQPIHKVSVKSFKMSKYEVTIKQFKQFAAATGYITNDTCWKYVTEGGGKFKVGYDIAPGNWLTPEYAPSDYHPVICVSWDDANAYLSWLSKQTGKKYRLPTEAEWEYAARAGSAGKYFFGDEDKDLCQYANTFDTSGMRAFIRDKHYQQKEMACDDGAEYTSVVGMYKPNAFGLYDMIGNVSEWVEDCDHPNYEGAPIDGSAWITEKCFMRSRKGSSYGPGNSHISMRGHGGQGNRSSLGEGFRIVEDICPASNKCKAISDTKNLLETELNEIQRVEHTKRNQVLN